MLIILEFTVLIIAYFRINVVYNQQEKLNGLSLDILIISGIDIAITIIV